MPSIQRRRGRHGRPAACTILDLANIFVDTTSTYWEVDESGQLADLYDTVDDDGTTRPLEQGERASCRRSDVVAA